MSYLDLLISRYQFVVHIRKETVKADQREADTT